MNPINKVIERIIADSITDTKTHFNVVHAVSLSCGFVELSFRSMMDLSLFNDNGYTNVFKRDTLIDTLKEFNLEFERVYCSTRVNGRRNSYMIDEEYKETIIQDDTPITDIAVALGLHNTVRISFKLPSGIDTDSIESDAKHMIENLKHASCTELNSYTLTLYGKSISVDGGYFKTKDFK